MDKTFICLANSYKRGGRCIAGVEVMIDENRHWTVVRNPNGTPHWIRPIDNTTEFGEIPEFEAVPIRLLSVIRLRDVTPCLCKAHSEDVSFSRMEFIGNILPCKAALEEMADLLHHEIFYNNDSAISLDIYAQGNYSLMLVRPERIELRPDITKLRAKYRMIISYHGTTYDLPVTDPDYLRELENTPSTPIPPHEAYLCLSLGMEFEGQHHKLIAGVIIPSDRNVSTPHIIKGNDAALWKTFEIRPFTLWERLTIKSATYIPSYRGPSIYLRKWNGDELFLPFENAPKLEAWTKISLRKTLLVTYEDESGTKVQRIRLKSV